ncbi:hypothetical protein ACJJTC_003313 [Scirpophaga incertulas]
MTLYHFGNCLALIYAPYHMAYKFSGISEYASFSKCVTAGCLYIFTQLCKMLFLATFFPDSDSSLSGEYDIILEFLKATVDFADLVGLYFAVNSVPGKGHAKIFTAAIGWASAEVLVTRGVDLWGGARGAEFDWRHVRGACEANVALLRTVAISALLWQRPKTKAMPALLATPYRPILETLLASALGLTAWGAVGLSAGVAILASAFALKLYAGTNAHY